MASTNEQETVNLIQDFWPDMGFQTREIINCETDFILRFYRAFFAELDERLSCIVGNTTEERENNVNWPEEVILFTRLQKFLSKMGYSVSLINLYVRNAKKMFPLIHLSIHFLIYINNFLDKIAPNIEAALQKFAETEDFKVIKNQLLCTRAETSEALGRVKEEHILCQKKLEEVNHKHAKVLEKGAAAERYEKEKRDELQKLQNEVDNLEYDIKNLEDTENELQSSLVTEEEYEYIKNRERFLQQEQENLKKDLADLAACNKSTENGLRLLEEQLHTFATLGDDFPIVNTLHESKQKLETGKENNNILKGDLASECNTVKLMEAKNHELNSKFESKIREQKEWAEKLCLNITRLEKMHNEAKEKSQLDLAKSEELQTATRQIEENIKIVENERKELEQVVIEKYTQTFNYNSRVMEKFQSILKRTNNLID